MAFLISNFLEPFSYLIYSVLFLLVVTRDGRFEKKLLFAYYVFSTFLILYASILAHFNTLGDNNWLYNLFFFLTISVNSIYFYKTYKTKAKKFFVVLVFIAYITWFIKVEIINGLFFDNYNNHVNALCFLGIVFYALLYFDQLLKNVSEKNILNDYDFWLVSGYLLYFLSCFFIVLVYKDGNIEQHRILWSLQNLILFASSLITLTGTLWINYQKKFL
jgi:hypothetical protein